MENEINQEDVDIRREKCIREASRKSHIERLVEDDLNKIFPPKFFHIAWIGFAVFGLLFMLSRFFDLMFGLSTKLPNAFASCLIVATIILCLVIGHRFLSEIFLSRNKNMYSALSDNELEFKYNKIIETARIQDKEKEEREKNTKSLSLMIKGFGIVTLSFVLLATNPDGKQFVSYLEEHPENILTHYERKNLYIFSGFRTIPTNQIYLGVLNNFFDITDLHTSKSK